MTIDQILEPKLIEYLRSKGHEVEQDNKVNHDLIVDGKTVECKYLSHTYNDIYCEIFQDCDVQYSEDTTAYQRANKQVLYGWAHRSGYCHADKLCIVHSRDKKITQISVLPREEFLDWMWDVHFRTHARQQAVFSYGGRYRTMGIIIPFHDIPANLIRTLRIETKDGLL